MALVIELGAPTTGANTYVTVAEFDTYLTDRGYTVTADKEPLLIKTFDFMQTLDWLEDNSFYRNSFGWFDPRIKYAYTIYPAHKNGQCEIAYRMSLGVDPGAEPDQLVKREKVDVLETEYFGGNSKGSAISLLLSMPIAYGILKDHLVTSPYLQRA